MMQCTCSYQSTKCQESVLFPPCVPGMALRSVALGAVHEPLSRLFGTASYSSESSVLLVVCLLSDCMAMVLLLIL